MNKKEVAEIKRRFKKESCTIDRMVGCYVDSNKDMVLTFNDTFIDLEEEEYYKYMEIISKCFSGTLGNNLLELPFDINAEIEGGGQDLLYKLRESRLTDEKLLLEYYQRIIDSYDYPGNYFIVMFHDTYDIPMKTNDNLLLDDSDEVYDYVVGAICPVELSKPALGYRPEENRIGSRTRDWVVKPVDTGFIYPCFTERSTDLHACMAYTKNANDPHTEFWENCLGCGSKRTSSQKKAAFANIIKKSIGEEGEDCEDTVLDIQQNLSDFIALESERLGEDESIILQPADVKDILTDSGVSEGKVNRITESYEQYFEGELPEAEELLDSRALKSNELRLEKIELKERVVDLTKQLEEVGAIAKDGRAANVVVKVDDERLTTVETTFVNGVKCLVIPLEPDDYTVINGEHRE